MCAEEADIRQVVRKKLVESLQASVEIGEFWVDKTQPVGFSGTEESGVGETFGEFGCLPNDGERLFECGIKDHMTRVNVRGLVVKNCLRCAHQDLGDARD